MILDLHWQKISLNIEGELWNHCKHFQTCFLGGLGKVSDLPLYGCLGSIGKLSESEDVMEVVD